MFMFFAKIGFKTLLDKFLKEALLLAINELFAHKEDIEAYLAQNIDLLADKTKEKLIDKVNKS